MIKLLTAVSLFFISSLFSLDIVKQEFLSPDIEHFDCHSSGIVETVPGSLCAVWKGGCGEGLSNMNMREGVGVWSSLFDGVQWTEPKEIASCPKSISWNPVITKLPSGDLVLFYRVGPSPRSFSSFMKRSKDGGSTWSKEEILPAGIVGPTKNKFIVTDEGAWICPSSAEAGAYTDELKATACWIEITKDEGKHWQKIGPIDLPHRKFGVISPALFYDKNKNLKLVCRDRGLRIGEKGFIWTATSTDNGYTWSELKPTILPNPDSGIDAVDLGEGKIVVIYNHSHTDRYPLNAAVSLDGGETWSAPTTLEAISGEFPAVIKTSDGLIHVTYAMAQPNRDQRRIKHIVIEPKSLGIPN